MKLLLTGDVHLGRRSSALSAIGGAVDGSAAGAWSRIVDLAIAEEVAAILVSGDLVDSRNRFFEATAPLESGIARLTRAGIEVIAVAGNHDHNVTPALFRSFARQQLSVSVLGARGGWETREIRRGEEVVRIVGWSFPSEQCEFDPTADFPINQVSAGGIPTIGLVHGDLDVADSKYARLSSARLESFGVQGWLLGHIHVPSLRASAGCPWILYPGSPQALDPGERGSHGAWLLEVVAGVRHAPRLVSVSTVQYAATGISLAGAASEDDVRPEIQSAIQRTVEQLAPGESVGVVVMDLDLVGESPFVSAVAQAADELLEATILAPGVEVKIRSATNQVAPPLALDDLAGGRDIRAALAQAIIGIERGDDSAGRESVELLREVMAAVRSRPLQCMVMDGDREVKLPMADEEVRRRAATAARLLLSAMVRGSDSGASDSTGGLP
jgi:predicted phosphodiesterase